ncbi:hypothetical protein MAM1_0024c01989 [Mucor ambiguus]|uniref:Uncharacterized protein n=1 Tax=Mucor ambiguus TaxID=91626 RepID=A0A0C9LS48_9FUNG|nr:hypothetical protein MAM1_0024c01989 [Mucor ambiguus]
MDSRRFLFVLLCSIHGKDRRAVQVYDFDCGSIRLVNAALGLKDAMFDFFFDLNKVEQICQSYGLRFGQHFVFCPGLKVVRITGAFIKHPVLCSCDGSLNKRKGPSMPPQDFHSVHEAERREILLKAELTATDPERDKLSKRTGSKTVSETSGKTGGKTDGKGEQMPNEELYWLIEGEKEKRDKTNVAIGKLSAIRRELYLVHKYLL